MDSESFEIQMSRLLMQISSFELKKKPRVLHGFVRGVVISLYLLCFCGRLKKEKWMNVQVGDIIKLENNEFVTVSINTPL